MSRIIYKGKIDNEFEGFDDNKLFKMANGTYWVQVKYQYWYHYKYRPDVIITEENGYYYLTVEGRKIQVSKIDVIESSIDGEFNGWEGETVYKLVNGQIWQQSSYKYEYTYAYRPDVMIYFVNGTYIMAVSGTEAEVKRIK